ncbi:HYR domain-containing protein [Algibacter sp. 2305UL17-15]|uniref:HYR domain-containing protein n=1 Tax=Algibacter sp. 2305UL17-15 TaxID=3231268 RepID=UPI0034586593
MLKKKIAQLLFLSLALLATACSSDGGSDEEMKEEKDTVNPTISCPANINETVDVFSSGKEITFTDPIGTDNLEGAVTTQTAGIKSGRFFPIGTTTNTFEVRDAAGNTASCSFDVIITKDAPSASLPYFIDINPTPTGKKWTKVENLSDEFETAFDDAKWHRDPATDGFGWIGRAPGLFEPDNVTVNGGNLTVTVDKLAAPQTIGTHTYTHGGAIVRSKAKAKQGHYFECRMQANKTVMSSTFWIAYKQNCNTGPQRKLELDIQECVGRFSGDPVKDPWAVNYDHIYASNTWRHKQSCDVSESVQSPGKTVLDEDNHSRFFVYGCWWKSPTEILFYLDGKLSHSITNPPADFDLEGHITMAIETYGWNPIDAANIFETASADDRSTKYDWVRTWKLDDE